MKFTIVGLLLIIYASNFAIEEKKALKFNIQNKDSKNILINVKLDEDSSSSNLKYLIKKGDTLAKIALKYKIPLKKIVEDNNIKNIDLIFADKYLELKREGI